MYRDPNAKPYMQQPAMGQPRFLNRLQGNASVDQRVNRLQGLQAQGNLSQGRENRLNKMLSYQEAQQSPFANFYQPRPMTNFGRPQFQPMPQFGNANLPANPFGQFQAGQNGQANFAQTSPQFQQPQFGQIQGQGMNRGQMANQAMNGLFNPQGGNYGY
jgi:hypothetical protein